MMRKILPWVLGVVICGYAGYLLLSELDGGKVGRGDRLGRPLCPGLNLDAVASVRIRGAAGSLELVKDREGWRVENALRYPADTVKIKELFAVMSRLKVLNTHRMTEDDLKSLDLGEPIEGGNSKAILMELLDGSGQALAAIIVGRDHKAIGDEQVADGRFVRLRGESAASVVPYLFPEAEVDGSLWLDRSFPASKTTRRITLRDGDSVVWSFTRADGDASMVMGDLPAGETLDDDVVSQLEHAVGYAAFSRVATAEEASGITLGDRRFEFETLDGYVYTWILGDGLIDDRLLPVKVSVALASGVESTDKMRERLRREQAHYGGWTYLLARSTFHPLSLSAKDFVKVMK